MPQCSLGPDNVICHVEMIWRLDGQDIYIYISRYAIVHANLDGADFLMNRVLVTLSLTVRLFSTGQQKRCSQEWNGVPHPLQEIVTTSLLHEVAAMYYRLFQDWMILYALPFCCQ